MEWLKPAKGIMNYMLQYLTMFLTNSCWQRIKLKKKLNILLLHLAIFIFLLNLVYLNNVEQEEN